MSLHTRCPQRIASTSAHRTVWRRRGIRHYVSGTASEPEWFQQVRTELLSRKPLYQREDLDLLHHEQLLTTLTGFAPRLPQLDGGAGPNIPLAQLLTRFNARVPSSKLLPDGTDPLHSPGEPWMRRMWAGGSVQLNPELKLKSETPFRHESRAACVERIKDVRLQGEGEAAKVFVSIERRFASVDQLKDAAESQFGGDTRKYMLQQVKSGAEWGDAWVKEERNLVFLKPKTAAELMAIQAGQTLVPRYLKAPTNPDSLYTLTPTRSLLFRYSALTFNGHLLHLDSTYARNAEGHRNLLVHGPLTLTLMLQAVNKHLRDSRTAKHLETVESIEYRNLAPLYSDEQMRIGVKKRKGTDKGSMWDVWVESPTGGMAVKAVVHTVGCGKGSSITEPATKIDPSTDLPNVQEVANQARNKLNALDQKDSSKEQLSQLSREERRKPLSEEQRNQQKDGGEPSSTKPQLQLPQGERPKSSRERVQYSNGSRKQWVGKALPYLYVWTNSALVTGTNLPARGDTAPNSGLSTAESDSPKSKSLKRPASTSKPVRDQPTSSVAASAPSPPSSVLTQAQRQRQVLLASTPVQTPSIRKVESTVPTITDSSPAATGTADSGPQTRIRRVESDNPGEAPASSDTSMQRTPELQEKDPKTVRPAQRRSKQRGKRASGLVIKKIEQVSIRKVVDHGLSDAASEKGSNKRSGAAHQRQALKRFVLNADKKEGVEGVGEETGQQ